MITPAIVARLAASKTIQHYVSGRLVVGSLSQGQPRPAMLVNQITTTPLEELSGLPVCDTTLVQVDIWVDQTVNSLTTLKELGNEVRKLIEGQRWSHDGYWFEGGALRRDNFTHQPPSKGSDLWLHRRSMDFEFIHTNQVARS